jgi:N-acetylglucosamine-6-phosphate deacetylase
VTELVLRPERLVTARGHQENLDLVISGERIVELRGSGHSAAEAVPGWVVPGFVDTHCHGGGGADYAGTDADEARRARRFHLEAGTTTSFASLVTAELDELVAQIETLRPLVAEGMLAGIHLEGPFLSPARCGAHDPALLVHPTPDRVERVLAAGRGTVRVVTLAPELPGGAEAIRAVVAQGATAAVGHTDADVDATAAAVGHGARVATHLFNAMPPVHHRAPGPVPMLLSDDRVLVELIADGFHLHPQVVALAVAAAGPERVALVTDAMAAAGMADGDYTVGKLAVAVRDGQARLVQPDGTPGSIAGSTLTMAAAVANMVRFGFGVPEIAVMAATAPAAAHGLTRVGVLEPGRRADLCVLDDAGRLQRVMQAGRWLET